MFIEIIVLPREEQSPKRRAAKASKAPPPGRAELARVWREEGKAFHGAVLEFIKAQHLLGAVKWMSEPGLLPQVTLVASDRVLEKLQAEPRFAAGRSLSMNLQT
ncbi:hypothetical protein COCOR_05178 [Corallococcus coralloides DSM 2259]|uniref:Uncharacterized protein n=1 Tax=Corallococcus coralloides (strain ATCC 25202 / DSM 2259 / NBRC 100086 / M2) TaxID=1144275 RepID=H8MST1_CORCM|nr:hypothetical protein [Corallococcus coralloides]AFE06234.1 hypothetical protein COCOR_05178 [Corallococcus coralloides DSM 2259]